MSEIALIRKIIVAAKKVPTQVQPSQPSTTKPKNPKPWKGRMGADSYLATINQPSGAHQRTEDKEGYKQKKKREDEAF